MITLPPRAHSYPHAGSKHGQVIRLTCSFQSGRKSRTGVLQPSFLTRRMSRSNCTSNPIDVPGQSKSRSAWPAGALLAQQYHCSGRSALAEPGATGCKVQLVRRRSSSTISPLCLATSWPIAKALPSSVASCAPPTFRNVMAGRACKSTWYSSRKVASLLSASTPKERLFACARKSA